MLTEWFAQWGDISLLQDKRNTNNLVANAVTRNFNFHLNIRENILIELKDAKRAINVAWKLYEGSDPKQPYCSKQMTIYGQ